MVETVLVADKLKLHLYNAKNGDTNEFHGELIMMDTDALSMFREMGFCMRRTGTSENWDCMRTRFATATAAMQEENPAVGSAYNIMDGYMVGDWNSPFYFSEDTDADITNDVTKNWRSIASKSSMTGCVADDTVATNYKCDKLVSHWYRNWTTTDGADLDAQLVDGDASVDFEVRGWFTTYSDPNWRSDKTSDVQSPAPVMAKAVFEAYLTAPAEEVTVIEEDTPEEEDDDNTADDGATNVTTFAATLMAAVYALAF